MKRYTTAITHDGSAHEDDFYSCCIAAHVYGVNRIMRKTQVTQEEKEDPHTLILDTGREHQPLLGNFDHHHFPHQKNTDDERCTVSLLLDDLGLYEPAKEIYPWLSRVEVQDKRGTHTMAKLYGIPPHLVRGMVETPVCSYVLEWFESATDIQATDALMAFMKSIGQKIHHGIISYQERMEFLKTHAKLIPLLTGFKLVYLESDHPITAPSMGINKFLQGADAPVMMSVDSSGPGWTLFRRNDDPRIDFMRIRGDERILFVHQKGFLAKTKCRLDIPEVKELIVASTK